MARLLKLVLRGFALLTGAWMVFGGGMCVLSSVFNFRPSGGYAMLFLLSLGVGLLMLWAGWKLLAYGGVVFSVKFSKKDRDETTGE